MITITKNQKEMEFKSKAIEIAILHGARTPWANCMGLLLGNINGEEVVVEQSIPLSHTIVMTPMLEIALKMVKELDTKSKVIGVYYCPERDNYSGIPPIAKKVSNIVGSFFKVSSPVLALMKATELSDETKFPFNIYQGPNYSQVIDSLKVLPSIEQVNATVTNQLRSKIFDTLKDFDDFVDDPSVDFTNSSI